MRRFFFFLRFRVKCLIFKPSTPIRWQAQDGLSRDNGQQDVGWVLRAVVDSLVGHRNLVAHAELTTGVEIPGESLV